MVLVSDYIRTHSSNRVHIQPSHQPQACTCARAFFRLHGNKR